MNDRFKFRVWNKITKTMQEVCLLTLDKDQHGAMSCCKNKCSVHLVYQPHYILMQCTGLKDKNGRLIYEGDICKIPEFSNFLFSIYFSEKDACFYAECQNSDGGATLTFSADFEVIGNIYENPELLDNKND